LRNSWRTPSGATIKNRFSVPAMLVAGPVLGWTLAHAGTHYAGWNIFTALEVNEKATVVGRNLVWMVGSPFELLSGIANENASIVTAVIGIIAFIRRRQLMPDLFLFHYGMVLLCWSWPPQRSLTVVLPLLLWMVYRAFQNMRTREAFAGFVVLVVALPLSCSLFRLPGRLVPDPAEPLYAWIRTNTASTATILANLDANATVRTGRRSVRGIDPSGYALWYAARPEAAVNAAALLRAVRTELPDYVVITAEKDLPESGAWRKAIEALERAGVLEAVPVPGSNRDYRLLKNLGR
jgi:hypothetical protein